MTKRLFTKVINRFGAWRSLQIGLAILSAILFTMAISQVFVPIHLQQTQAENTSEFIPNENISTLLNDNKDKTKSQITYRPGMFQPATDLADKPLANKTIERIKDQLKLQCVMEMNGQTVAYINIQGVGLRKCTIGENVNDLFTVLDINKQNKSVDISIVEHRVTLHL